MHDAKLPRSQSRLQAVVSAVGVVSDWRHRGVGSNLKLTAMANVAAEYDAVLLSEVHRANTAMLELNKKLGVRISAELLPGTEYRATAIAVTVPWHRRIPRDLRRRRKQKQTGQAATP
jgi:hypothetical protein